MKPVFWILILVVAAAVIAAVILIKKKKAGACEEPEELCPEKDACTASEEVTRDMPAEDIPDRAADAGISFAVTEEIPVEPDQSRLTEEYIAWAEENNLLPVTREAEAAEPDVPDSPEEAPKEAPEETAENPKEE